LQQYCANHDRSAIKLQNLAGFGNIRASGQFFDFSDVSPMRPAINGDNMQSGLRPDHVIKTRHEKNFRALRFLALTRQNAVLKGLH
jgi:hypothetical protein